MNRKVHIAIALILIVVSCTQNQEQFSPAPFNPEVIEINGSIISNDSLFGPKKNFVGKPNIIKVKSAKLIPANINVTEARNPIIVKAGLPQTIKYKFSFSDSSKIIILNDSTYIAGLPVLTIAKEASIKDNNSQNFSCFNKLQGLKHAGITSIIQDKNGNIWFGSSGGICKYDGKYFSNYGEKEGLSSIIVNSILQDKNENIWIGTDGGGVFKYDGKCFSNLNEKNGFINNQVKSLLQDNDGNIWFGTEAGVCKYDGKYFTNISEKEGLVNNNVWNILQDINNNFWFCTDGGISKYDGKSFVNYTEKEGLLNNQVWSAIQDKYGLLWFGTSGGLSIFDENYFINYTEKVGLLNNIVTTMFEDNNGSIWLGTDGGICNCYYDRTTKLEIDNQYNNRINSRYIRTFANYTETEGLSNNQVWSILQDKSGNLWFGTFSGINKYNGRTFTNYTENEGLPNNLVSSILQDIKGNLWFGTEGGGVSKYDGKFFTNYTENDGLVNNIVRTIIEDQNGNLWFGTLGGLSKYNGITFENYTEKQGLVSTQIRTAINDKKGNIWLGTEENGIIKYDGKYFTNYTMKEGLSNDHVLSVLNDSKGNIWIGTDGGGVSKFDGNIFTHFTQNEGFPNNQILSIMEDSKGNLWFGTHGGGVSKYDGKYITIYTEKEGLSNNYVFNMLIDKSGNLWLGTRYGLCKSEKKYFSKLIDYPYNINEFKKYNNDAFFKNYSPEDGFLGIGVNGGRTIYEDKSGCIWIGSNDRLVAYHPEGDEPDTIPPNIQLTKIELFNENISWENLEIKRAPEFNNVTKTHSINVAQDTSFILGNGVSVGGFKFDGISKWYGLPENLSLAYNNNYITFNFIGITQKQNKKIKYQFKLEGVDENWSGLTTRREAPYGNLMPGNYTFKVKTINSEGIWSKELNYSFTIRPPWWKTLWFRTILALSSILLIIAYIKWRERKLKADKLLLEKKVKEQTCLLSEKNEELYLQNEEIIAQRDEISSQRDEIEAQRDLVTIQKEHIEEIYKDITDSINYAERIQGSFLASKEILDENFHEHFVFFHPKDVVSGDFYWASKLSNGNFALATADSTGHGVPGAIMSILNISSLEKAVEQGLCEPSEILNHTRNTIIERLKKDGSPEGGKDGMDASLICFDFANNLFKYSAANNPIWVIRENQLIELNPDKMPVGKHDKDQIPFTQNEFKLQKGDVVYTLTDGLPDQFGGPKGKKFKSTQLKDLFLSIHLKPLEEQKRLLEESLANWRGNLEQVDDVTIIGIKI